MADDSGGPPLPRRVPGATVSPGQAVRVERLAIPEDLRQRLLTAIANEQLRDEAEARRGTQPGAAPDEAAAQAGTFPAAGPQPAAAPDQADVQALAPDPATHQAVAAGEADLQVPALDQDAASAPTVWSPVPRPADLQEPALGQEADQAASAPTVWSPVPRLADLQEPALGQEADQAASAPTVWSPVRRPADLPAPDQAAHPASAPGQPDPQPVPPLPRRVPGENGAPPAPAHIRREFLPPWLLGRRLDSDAHTEPPAGITGFRADDPAARDSARPAEDPAAAPTLPAGTPPLLPTLPGSAPPGSGETGATPPDLARVPPPPAVQASPTAPAASRPAGPASPATTVSPGPPDQHRKQPGNGAVSPAPEVPPTSMKEQWSGRRYRVAGLLVAVIALAAAVIALLLSGRAGSAGNGYSGLGGAPGAGAGERNLAAAWVAGQVNRAAVVACDPIMCHVLAAHGVPSRDLYPLEPGATSPVRFEIIVATPQVRAKFGNLLRSGYAPAVLASFGSGPRRIEIRQVARHGAAAYRAMLGADLFARKAAGAELLRSNRIAVAPVARQELSAGRVDSRLLIAVAEMASVRPMYIINFGSVAPGADPDLPLRFADLSETGRADRHFGRSARYVRSMVSFLHGQHILFRPAHVATVFLVGGTRALRIEFPAPSPLGLLGPHRPGRR
jgi:hypothetical protein